MAEFVTLTKRIGDERRLGAGQSMEIRFRPLGPGRISISSAGHGPLASDDPEPEPEESYLPCRTEIFRPGDAVPVATGRSTLGSEGLLQYTVSQQDFGLAGDWTCKVTSTTARPGRFLFHASIALSYDVELWTATVDLKFVNTLIQRALEVARLRVHLETHATQSRSWIGWSTVIAEQFGLSQQQFFQLEPFEAEWPLNLPLPPIVINIHDLNLEGLEAMFVARQAGEVRVFVKATFETSGREITTSVGSHNITHFSVIVEFRLDGSSPRVDCNLIPAEFEILDLPVRNVKEEVRKQLVQRLANARLRATLSDYLNGFVTHFFRLGPGARLHRVAIDGRRLVVKYFNERPDPRRPLPAIRRLAGTGLPSPIRSTTRLAVGATHAIRVPLRQSGLVTVVSRVSRGQAPSQEVDPETGQPLPAAPLFHTVSLTRSLGGTTQVVATAQGTGPMLVIHETLRDSEGTWTVEIRNGSDIIVKVDASVYFPFVQGNLGKFDHIVVVMMENRSFDHMLGYLSLDGREDIDGLTGKESNTYNGVAHKVFPLEHTQFCGDPGHDGKDVDEQIAGGMKGFVTNFAKHPKRGPEAPGRIMGYHVGQQLPAYDFFAREFAVCDRWFSSVPGYTWPNRLYSIAGTSDGLRDGKPIDPDNLPAYEFKTIFEVLHEHGVSWNYFFSDLPFPVFFRRFVQDAVFSEGVRPISEFYERAQTGDLPAVTWLEPSFLDTDEPTAASDDHPPGDVASGQHFVGWVYRTLASSPLWLRTLLVIVYDEHGGFYDHVQPPPAPDDRAQSRRYGVRVPAIVISPWIARRSVGKSIYDHTSILRTILERFCIRGGDAAKMGARVDNAADLGDLLKEVRPRERAPVLPAFGRPPVPPCERPSDGKPPNDLAEILMLMSLGMRAP